MAIISMIFAATILTEGSGLVMNGIFRGRSAENSCFDLYFAIEGEDQDPSPYLDYIAEHIAVDQSVLYQVYLTDSPTVRDYIESQTVYYYYNYDHRGLSGSGARAGPVSHPLHDLFAGTSTELRTAGHPGKHHIISGERLYRTSLSRFWRGEWAWVYSGRSG